MFEQQKNIRSLLIVVDYSDLNTEPVIICGHKFVVQSFLFQNNRHLYVAGLENVFVKEMGFIQLCTVLCCSTS